MLPSFEIKRLKDRIGARGSILKEPNLSMSSISQSDLSYALALADRLLSSIPQYTIANPISAIAMTYQAMILHGRQHPSASIALSAVVVESAIAELMFGFGLVSGVARRLSLPVKAARASIPPISRNKFSGLSFANMVQILNEKGFIDNYLAARINELRKARNELMHYSKEPSPHQSGQILTAVRDVLALTTGETEFVLNMGFTYRI